MFRGKLSGLYTSVGVPTENEDTLKYIFLKQVHDDLIIFKKIEYNLDNCIDHCSVTTPMDTI